jgi:endonuclease YncB( thermonuclease family)
VAITLDHPAVIDTATLQAGKTTITLYGIEGVSGEARDGLQAFLASTDQHLRCQADSSEGFVCLMSDGTDIAQVALVNGAARTRDDAPDSYREQEAAAQAARRGIWANLPPPPVLVQHPIIQDTATLATDSQVFVLDGLQGLGQPYASQLQSYIAANGDSLTCYPKGLVGSYVCVMGDGTDLAKVALVNGAAIVAPDAPDSYRIQQADALNNRRGIWLSPPPDILVATAPLPDSQEYVLVAGDDGADGISYVGGEPMAMIDGESVVLVYGGAAGWGYYDHYHHWRGAPDRYRMHMEHFHHDGFGLRGYGHDLEARRESVMRREAMAGHPGFGGRPGFEERGGMHPPGVAGIPGHPGMPGPGGMHPPGGMAGVPGHPGMAGVPGHPGMAGPGGMHPPGAMASAAGHPGMGGPGAMHPPGMAGAPGHPGGGFGGGFARPTAMASVGGFHPGGMQATHAAAAPHPSGGGGGGHKH